MAQTSTAHNACDASIWLDNHTGNATNISGSSASVDSSFEQMVEAFRTFGSRWPRRLECGKDASFTVNVVYSTTDDEGWDILKEWYFDSSPGARTIGIYMPDKDVGSDYIYGEVRITNMSWTLDPSDANAIMVSATMLPDGEITHTVAST